MTANDTACFARPVSPPARNEVSAGTAATLEVQPRAHPARCRWGRPRPASPTVLAGGAGGACENARGQRAERSAPSKAGQRGRAAGGGEEGSVPVTLDVPAPAATHDAAALDLVVIGLGYVGLPLAQEAVRSGLRVAGYDRDERVVRSLAAGSSHVDDVPAGDVAAMLDRGFAPTPEAAIIGRARAVVICVPTPLSEDGAPDLGAVRSATGDVAEHLSPGTLV